MTNMDSSATMPLAEWLGYNTATLAALREQRVI
ncbi:unnamed protein product [Mycetohabitans rhizoxinica HKI 454]|uniref:Uncharacterized protein n=1 Tax=Mycetohabitans rhizoxinica (strain DSM 19002 / CIP 109453 / HKI 454) TaxID=882378 RepID=E5AP77_MYCRK|nr:unnamed protein product [Mycetohabitans rhizoxinica HKI 454]